MIELRSTYVGCHLDLTDGGARNSALGHQPSYRRHDAITGFLPLGVIVSGSPLASYVVTVSASQTAPVVLFKRAGTEATLDCSSYSISLT